MAYDSYKLWEIITKKVCDDLCITTKKPNISNLLLNLFIFGVIIIISSIFFSKKGGANMDGITALIRSEIKKQFGTLKEFSKASGIPYSTLTNTLTKGVDGTSYGTVRRICKLLNLKQSSDTDMVLVNETFVNLFVKLSSLDSQGMHTVSTVIDMEYNRCMNEGGSPVIKAFNNIGLGVIEEDSAPARSVGENNEH